MASNYVFPPPIKTLIYSVDRAMDLFNKSDNLWVCLGKQTAWQDSDYGNVTVPSDKDGNPPAPDPGLTNIEEPVGYKKIAAVYFVVPYTNGQSVPSGQHTIDYGSSQWLTVDKSVVYEQLVTTLAWEIDIMKDDFPDAPFRQVGLYSDLKIKDGVDSNLEILTPDQVDNPGHLEMVHNRPISYLNGSTNRTHISYVMTN